MTTRTADGRGGGRRWRDRPGRGLAGRLGRACRHRGRPRPRARGQLGGGRDARTGGRGPLRRGRPDPAERGRRPGLARIRRTSSRELPVTWSTTGPSGTLLVAADASDRAAVDDVLQYQLALGLRARRLTSPQCRAAEPLLAPGVRAGVELADDHQVDNRRVVDALLDACRSCPSPSWRTRLAEVTADTTGVTGVTLRWGGRLDAGSVVLAAGCHSGRVGGVPEALRPPVRPVKGLTLRLRAPGGAPRLQRTLRGLVHGRNCYLVPRPDGTVVVGATVEEKGFDLTVQAGSVAQLLDDARRLVPAIDEYELRETTTGLRPGLARTTPPSSGPPGFPVCVVATGHYRNGDPVGPGHRRRGGQGARGPGRRSGCSSTSAPTGSSGPPSLRGRDPAASGAVDR